jgi:hypothetical protein
MESRRKPKAAAGYINLLLKLRVYESLQGSCRVYRSFALLLYSILILATNLYAVGGDAVAVAKPVFQSI